MVLGEFLSSLIKELGSIRGRLAIDVLEQLKLQPEVFDECLAELACQWIAEDAIPSGNEPIHEFSWFDHLKTEPADVIKFQLDLVTLSEKEQAEIHITILYRAGLLSAHCGRRFAEELETLSRLLKQYYRNDDNE